MANSILEQTVINDLQDVERMGREIRVYEAEQKNRFLRKKV